MSTESPEEMQARMQAEHRARQRAQQLEIPGISGKAGEILSHLIEDEPIFVFRAKDLLSTFALDEYAKMVEKFNPDSPQLVSIVDATNDFREWQRNHPGLVHLPD